MKIIILLVFLFVLLANPITGGKLFPGFNNPEKWMKRVIRKLQRKTSAYGNMIASNTAEISNTAGFISSIGKCEDNYINDPDNGLSCCFEDNSNEGQCLCNGMTIDDPSNPGSCCIANQRHPDHCLCSGTDIDDLNNPGNCCFKDENNPTQCLCNGNYTDNPNKRCFNLDWKGDGICDDQNNHAGCDFDGKDCCGRDADTALCTLCQCLEGEAPSQNAVGCCYQNPNKTGECLCTGKYTDDPDNAGSCCVEDPDSPGTCCIGSITCNGQGTCSSGNSGICACDSGFTGDRCNITTCPGTSGKVCSGNGNCLQGPPLECQCQAGFNGNDCANMQCPADGTCSSQGICDVSNGTCVCNSGFEGDICQDMQCPGDGTCSTQGICDVSTGTCVCNSGFLGDTCQVEMMIPTDSELIMVLGGQNGCWKSCFVPDCYIFNFTDPSTICTCPDYPINTAFATGGVVNGEVIVCGGYCMPACYKLDLQSNSWIYLADVPTNTEENAESCGWLPSAELNGALWVAGGYMINGGSSDQTSLIYPNGTVTEGPTLLPEKDYGHSMATLHDGRIAFCNLKSKQYIYDPATNTFSTLPNTGKPAHGCVAFNCAIYDYRPTLIAITSANAKTDVEILDYTSPDATWEYVNSLTFTIEGDLREQLLTTPSGDGVLFQYKAHFYELSCDTTTCTWFIRNEDMPSSPGPHASIMKYLPSGFKCPE